LGKCLKTRKEWIGQLQIPQVPCKGKDKPKRVRVATDFDGRGLKRTCKRQAEQPWLTKADRMPRGGVWIRATNSGTSKNTKRVPFKVDRIPDQGGY
jgi:hypothetical protein